MEFIKYFRVQNGTGFAKSREMLSVSSSNKLQLQSLRKKVHIGSEQHNRNFIPLRLSENLYGSQEPPKKNLINIQKLENFLNHASEKSSISSNEIKEIIDESNKFNRKIETEKLMHKGGQIK